MPFARPLSRSGITSTARASVATSCRAANTLWANSQAVNWPGEARPSRDSPMSVGHHAKLSHQDPRPTSPTRKADTVDQRSANEFQSPRQHHGGQNVPDCARIHALLCEKCGEGDGGGSPKGCPWRESCRRHKQSLCLSRLGPLYIVFAGDQRDATPTGRRWDLNWRRSALAYPRRSRL